MDKRHDSVAPKSGQFEGKPYNEMPIIMRVDGEHAVRVDCPWLRPPQGYLSDLRRFRLAKSPIRQNSVTVNTPMAAS
jgi:hypothetical protein